MSRPQTEGGTVSRDYEGKPKPPSAADQYHWETRTCIDCDAAFAMRVRWNQTYRFHRCHDCSVALYELRVATGHLERTSIVEAPPLPKIDPAARLKRPGPPRPEPFERSTPPAAVSYYERRRRERELAQLERQRAATADAKLKTFQDGGATA